MNISEFPKVTVILRGYTTDQVNTVLEVLDEETESHKYALEITLNSPDVFETLKDISRKYGNEFHIGAGTVMNLEDAKNAVNAGAQFILSPVQLEKEVLDFCKSNQVATVPAAMSPSEVYKMKKEGADIIKVFPAAAIGPTFFKDIQSPLGQLPLMAVGGVSAENAQDFFDNGASFVGIGSGLFNKEDILNQNKEGLKNSLKYFEDTVFQR
ncbi:bifunctional 4-hydroxy-2-oxoglutarate aldolase/2-dehydro-3-deoxy-phosphogluconate aldolase [Atopococcus tabaci]|uniref:bifunctional 4-hydroxy-2-oxoglutarate aldolase/2-dehydro-3-deoxy-phosphogluconate aldolase n=1 Tax=Atopococcus tabaci TaxID=269774 RepID=UPI0004081FFC|nr:bifunctional 4-hydroxy-2-oxoglutarate aldolase/2-dehydro-3-deoxy-phosphogluconate aldolase [Atopococcus tabaci]